MPRRLSVEKAALCLVPLLAACSPKPSIAQNPASLDVHDVQGAGATSPLAGDTVRVRGVVTGDFQDYGGDDAGDLGGFYIMSMEPDADAATSEGLFVFEKGRELGDVQPGDIVDVTGVVTEYFDETQLAAVSLERSGRQAFEPTVLEFPVTDLESREGMLVTIPEPLVIAGNRNLERFGTLSLAAGDRPYQFTNVNLPDRDGFRQARLLARSNRLILDDGFRKENPRRIRYLEQDVPPRSGNTISGVTGNLRWSRGSGGNGDQAYRLMPTSTPEIEASNPRRLPPDRRGNLRVVSFNLLNLFSGLNDGNPTCGPRGDANCRGANTAAERERQLTKTVTALRLLDADIVAVAELENDARGSLEMLAAALDAAGLDYGYVDAGVIGADTIKVGLLFRVGRVRPVGNFTLLTARADGRFNDRKNRPALAQAFQPVDSDARITVIANHLKSKGSDCDDVNDPNRGDGQGNCNRTRTLAASALAEFAMSKPTPASGDKVLVVGDLNAYLREDPLRAMEAAGLVNLLATGIGSDAYSYVYDGAAGALDHALATPALAADVEQVFEWHSNADEPRVFDYNLEFGRDPAYFDGDTPWRSSDHDPVVVDLELTP